MSRMSPCGSRCEKSSISRKSCREKETKEEGGRKEVCVCVCVCVCACRGGVGVSLKIRNKFKVEDASSNVTCSGQI